MHNFSNIQKFQTHSLNHLNDVTLGILHSIKESNEYIFYSLIIPSFILL